MPVYPSGRPNRVDGSPLRVCGDRSRVRGIGRIGRSALPLLLMLSIFCAGPGRALAQSGPFLNWENPPVHPIAISPDGSLLAVANLADNRVEFYDLTPGIPLPAGQVMVGLDPVTVRFRTATEVWAVNVISDTISVIDVSAAPKVVATIATMDEPRDVVFVAGSPERAFVSCSAVNTIQIFDTATRAQINTVVVQGEEPRSLALSPDGTKVYAAIFESGNGTTLIGGGADNTNTIAFPPNGVSHAAGPYGGVNPPPNNGGGFSPPINPALPPPPDVAMIVRKNAAGQWFDDNGGNWTNLVSGPQAALSGRPVGWDLVDNDVAIIDTTTLAVTYGTRLMNICMSLSVNPANGQVYVVGTEALNEIRFEPNVNGRFVHVQVGIVDPLTPATVGIVDLNPHIVPEYANHDPQVPQAERDRSIGDPRGIAWSADGSRGYVTGMGSNNLIVIDAAGNRISGTDLAPVEVGVGPTGVVVDDGRNQLYVLNRFGGSIAVVDATTLELKNDVRFFDPTPPVIRIGRKHLYDTHKNSGLGHLSCASCHIDSRMDRLAWDLGDPSGTLDPTAGQNDFIDGAFGLADLIDANFHPMKGPMTTQTLQDIIGKEPLHWRGDRDGIENFNPAFIGLQSDDTNLTAGEMQEFENFLATIHFPPNPFRNFNNTLPSSMPLPGNKNPGRFGTDGAPLPNGNAVNGLQIYRRGPGGAALDAGALDCVSCHTLPTGAGPNRQAQLNFISINFVLIPDGPMGNKHLGLVSIDGSTQDAIKIPHFRNAYNKSGYDMHPGGSPSLAGFGFVHDGSVDSVARFVAEPVFDVTSDQNIADLTAFVLASAGSDLPAGFTTGTALFPRNIEPLGEPSRDAHASTGRQVTIDSGAANPMITAMMAEANKADVLTRGLLTQRGLDLVVRQVVGGVERGWSYNRVAANFRSDRDSDPTLTQAALQAMAAPGSEQTWTLVPRGSGNRIGIDRDQDTFGDRTEIEACSDPNDALSTPLTGQPEADATASVDFGQQDPGAGPTGVMTVVLQNTGTAPLRFNGPLPALTGPDAAEFAIVSPVSGAPIPPTGSMQVDIVFDPAGFGLRAAYLTLVTTDCDEAVINVPLLGEGAVIGPVPTASPSADPTATPSPDPTATPSPSADPTSTPPPAPTATPSADATATPTPSPSADPTATPSAEPTATPSADPTATPSADATPTPSPSADPTATPSAEPTATPSADPTATPSADATPTPSPSADPTATPSAEPTATPSADPTATPSADATPTPSPSADPTATPSPYPTATPSADASATPAPPTPTSTPFICCPGDADNSGSFVDAADFIAVQANFGADHPVGGLGDANCSGGFVDANDFIAVQANFGADCG